MTPLVWTLLLAAPIEQATSADVYAHSPSFAEEPGRMLKELKPKRKYCNTTQYSLQGDYAYEACGAFCKQAKATNHCKFCKCRAYVLLCLQIDGEASVLTVKPSHTSLALHVCLSQLRLLQGGSGGERQQQRAEGREQRQQRKRYFRLHDVTQEEEGRTGQQEASRWQRQQEEGKEDPEAEASANRELDEPVSCIESALRRQRALTSPSLALTSSRRNAYRKSGAAEQVA